MVHHVRGASLARRSVRTRDASTTSIFLPYCLLPPSPTRERNPACARRLVWSYGRGRCTVGAVATATLQQQHQAPNTKLQPSVEQGSDSWCDAARKHRIHPPTGPSAPRAFAIDVENGRSGPTASREANARLSLPRILGGRLEVQRVGRWGAWPRPARGTRRHQLDAGRLLRPSVLAVRNQTMAGHARNPSRSSSLTSSSSYPVATYEILLSRFLPSGHGIGWFGTPTLLRTRQLNNRLETIRSKHRRSDYATASSKKTSSSSTTASSIAEKE